MSQLIFRLLQRSFIELIIILVICLQNLVLKALKVAGYEVTGEDRKQLQSIEEKCSPCQRNSILPRRPRIAFPEPVIYNQKLL